MVRGEFKSLLKNPLLLIVLIVIMFIPTIYATPFLASMWDPYGEISNLPVAVVNEDQKVIYNDEVLKVGDNLVDNLKDNDSLKFNFVDADTAEQGLKNGTYYLIITIPRDFSENAATVMDKNPQNLKLLYKTNPGTNYIASKLCDSAVEKIRTSVSEEVTKTYTETVFDSFDDITAGMDDAADGSDKMLDGEKDLIDGNEKITTNLNTLATGGFTLLDGTKTLQSGVKTYTEGVATVNTGVGTLGRGVTTFGTTASKGTKKLAKGASALETGLTAYTEGVDSAKQGAETLTSNNEKLNTGVITLSEGVGNLVTGSGNLKSGLSALSDTVGTSISSASASDGDVAKLKKGMSDFGDNLSGLNKMIQRYSVTATGSVDTSKVTSVDTCKSEISGASDSITKARNALDGINTDGMTEEQVNAISSAKTAIDSAKSSADSAKTASNEVQSQLKNLEVKVETKETVSLAQIKGTSSAIASAYPGLVSGVNSGVSTLVGGLSTIKSTVDDKFIPGAESLEDGLKKVQTGIDGDTGLKAGISSYTAGVSSLETGLSTLSSKNDTLNSGASTLTEGVGTLQTGLKKGTNQLSTGVSTLKEGTEKLVSNNSTLNSGTSKLVSGADKIADGAEKLEDGSSTLGEGLVTLKDGTQELKDGMVDGSQEVKDNKADAKSIEMMSNPVEKEGTQETTVADNGHAMAAYMMSVALWVGALAFCLMYPLTKYNGKLKSGAAWWLSKAAVLYPLAVGMALFMLTILHKVCGFDPVQWKNTIVMACATALAFMSIMYFFNALFGKVGSFLMLVFMVIQLSGSAGTYPIEISGGFVKTINPFLPFTYSVNGFRSTIAGGQDISNCVHVMIVLTIVFSILSILLFIYRAGRIKNGKRTMYDFIEEKGFA